MRPAVPKKLIIQRNPDNATSPADSMHVVVANYKPLGRLASWRHNYTLQLTATLACPHRIQRQRSTLNIHTQWKSENSDDNSQSIFQWTVGWYDFFVTWHGMTTSRLPSSHLPTSAATCWSNYNPQLTRMTLKVLDWRHATTPQGLIYWHQHLSISSTKYTHEWQLTLHYI